MSNPYRTPQADMPSGCLGIFLLVIGIILLIPGVCSVLFIIGTASGPRSSFRLNDPGLILLWVFCFAVAVGGAALVRHALRRLR
jgi:hypothetical protein